ncbi:GNAT family acetyltransferase YjcF [Bacillus sp. JCM 19047]|nr:GNAT family acetyltransferase YjcF [Bacillus sp. JCM 19047]
MAAQVERDEHDKTATHLLLTANQKAIGAARIRMVGKAGKIERVSILEPYRNKGYGEQLMKKIEEVGFAKGVDELVLNAQEPALAFYLRLGYLKTSERFFEAGIPHFSMKKGR